MRGLNEDMKGEIRKRRIMNLIEAVPAVVISVICGIVGSFIGMAIARMIGIL